MDAFGKIVRRIVPLSLISLLLSPCAFASWEENASRATVTIHDHATEQVIKDKEECLEVVNGEDGMAGGDYWKQGAPYYNIWLFPPTGYVQVTSTVSCDALYIQYHSSDINDGITDIYVDNMDDPVARIDTYNRGQWYVEVRGLSDTTHTVKIHASGDSDTTGVIRSPHRANPQLGDNDVWYFGFADRRPDPAYSHVEWRDPVCDSTKAFVCPCGGGSGLYASIRDQLDQPMAGVVVAMCLEASCKVCVCPPDTAVTDTSGAAVIAIHAGLDVSADTACCVVTTAVTCLGDTIPWKGTGGALTDTRDWLSPDMDGNCSVGVSDDFIIFYVDWMTSACRTDYDCDDLVATIDYALFMTHYDHSCEPISGVEDVAGGLPGRSTLSQNYPNPFNPATRIGFTTTRPGRVVLRIYDVKGRQVRTLIDGHRGAGAHEVAWDGRDDEGAAVTSGVYFYRLEGPGHTETKKMVLLR